MHVDIRRKNVHREISFPRVCKHMEKNYIGLKKQQNPTCIHREYPAGWLAKSREHFFVQISSFLARNHVNHLSHYYFCTQVKEKMWVIALRPCVTHETQPAAEKFMKALLYAFYHLSFLFLRFPNFPSSHSISVSDIQKK